MPVAGSGTVEEYRAALSEVGDPVTEAPPEVEAAIRHTVDNLDSLPAVSKASLAALIQRSPEAVPILAAIVGLSRERLKGQLKHHLGSPAWVTRARTDPGSIIELLDRAFSLIECVTISRHHSYTLADVLLAQAAATSSAGGAITTGRRLEDAVQAVIEQLGLPFVARTQFHGARGTGPADFAIPANGKDARIAIGVKGFDSTGSKLADAFTEIERMSQVRSAGQFVFAVVDGIAWKSRGGDLRRLIELVREARIDGLFPMEEFDLFEDALLDAAVRARLLDP